MYVKIGAERDSRRVDGGFATRAKRQSSITFAVSHEPIIC